MRAMFAIAVGVFTLVFVSAAAHAACDARSSDHLVTLIELYTSEGCDSCPPADKWLSRLTPTEETRAIAIAFHVDYWDRLGWVDRFASAKYTARQYEQMHRQQSGFVFTPQVILQGRDFGQWSASGQPAAAVATVNARPARALIELAAEPQGTSAIVDLHVKVPDVHDRAHASVAVALVQSKLTSDVRAGENAGKQLHHDHVVRQWRDGLALDASGELRQRLQFPLPAESGPVEVVAFAEDAKGGDVLQALALPLCEHP